MTKTLLLLLCPTWLWAQARLGSTESEIRAEFPGITFEIRYLDEVHMVDTLVLSKRYLLATFNNDRFVFYKFDNQGICRVVLISPLNSGRLHGMIEQYNKEYVIVSDTEWKLYTKSGVMKISLHQTDNGDYFFQYRMSKL